MMTFEPKLLRAATAIAALVLVTACDPAPKPAAKAPPAAPADTVKTPAAAPVGAAVDPEVRELRAQEAVLLKAMGQPNARVGRQLQIRWDGRVVLVMTDNDESFHVLTGVVKVPTSDGVFTFYEVTTHFNESPDGPSAMFYDEWGTPIESYDGYGQWRGAVFAIARREETFSVGDDGRVSTQLLDWSMKPHRKFDFKSRCQPTTWVSDTKIKGVCMRPASQAANPGMDLRNDEEEIEAVFTQVGLNSWRVRELRAPKAKLLDFPDNPTTAYDETVEGVVYSGDRTSPE